MSRSISKVGYVLKRYPRYSETFVVNEILAHEQSGLDIQIFALRPPADTHFQDIIARVRGAVSYLPYAGVKAQDFWLALEKTSCLIPEIWGRLEYARDELARDVIQAVVLAQRIRESGIEHLHAHFATSAASVARLAAHFAGITFSITAHAKDIFHEEVEADDVAKKFRAASAVVTVSDFNVAFLRDQYGTDADRVGRIYNGLDLDQFPYREIEDGTRHIIAVGRLIEKKGFIDLVDACQLLTQRGVDFRCSIIGSGPLHEPLQQRIDQLQLDRVSLLGPRPQQEIKTLVQNASVFAAPCVVGGDGNQDGLPTVLLESMALGTACVSTDVTGIPEAVIDRQTGLIVEQHSPAQLADALQLLLEDQPTRLHCSRNARALMERSFDAHKNAAAQRAVFAEGYERLVEKRVAG